MAHVLLADSSSGGRGASDHMPLFDHFRRVGLEELTPWFEFQGYTSKADLAKLKADDVTKWCPPVRWNIGTARRLKLLLGAWWFPCGL